MKTKLILVVFIFLFSFACVTQRKIRGTFLSFGINYPEQVLVLFSNGEYEDYYKSIQRVVRGNWEMVEDTVFTYPHIISGVRYSGKGEKVYDPNDVYCHWIWPQKFLVKNNSTLIDRTDFETLPLPYKRDTFFKLLFWKTDVHTDKNNYDAYHKNNKYQIKDVYLYKFRDHKPRKN